MESNEEILPHKDIYQERLTNRTKDLDGLRKSDGQFLVVGTRENGSRWVVWGGKTRKGAERFLAKQPVWQAKRYSIVDRAKSTHTEEHNFKMDHGDAAWLPEGDGCAICDRFHELARAAAEAL